MQIPKEDRAPVIAAMAASFAMIAQQVAGKATRDALFLGSFGANELPKVMVASAALSVTSVLLMSRILQRHGPQLIVPIAFFLSGGLFVVEWYLAARTELVAWLVYLHMAGFGSIVISGFWSVVNERFDPHAAKRYVARIAIGSTLGGIAGGVSAERIAVLLDVRTGLLVLGLLHVVAGFFVLRIGRPKHKHVEIIPDARSGLRIIKDSPYLQKLALLVSLVAVSSTLVDFALKAQADATITHEASLMRFFAAFYTGAAILTFVLQSTLGTRALAKLGLDGTIALLPGAVVLLGVLGAASSRLWTAIVLRGTETVLSNSLFRSGYELLYTPVRPEQKRPTKTIIDVAFERMGDAGGSGLILVVLAITVSAEQSRTLVVVLAVLASLVALWVTRSLNRGYVSVLAESLKTGTVHLDESEIVDATTRRTLAETTMALDRQKLLEQIRELRTKQGLSDAPGPRDSVPSHPDVAELPPPPLDHTPLAEATDDLLSHDLDRIVPRLEGDPDPKLTPLLIPLLERPEIYMMVIDALRRIGPRITGQLIDVLVESSTPFVIRRRVPRILSHILTQRAVDGIVLGLSDDRFEVRYQCGRSLARITRHEPSVRVSSETIYASVDKELAVGKKVWESQRLLDDSEDDSSPWLDGVLRARVHRSIEHIFTLLSLVLDREPLELCLRALDSKNRDLRGTALEYLENVLPSDIKSKLWPYLGHVKTSLTKARPPAQIVEDLLRSMDSLAIDRKDLDEELEKERR